MPVYFTPSVIALEAPWVSRALVPEEMEGVGMAQASSEGWAWGVELSGDEKTGMRRSQPSGLSFPTCGLSFSIWDMGIPPGGEGTIVRLRSLPWEGRRSEGEKSLSG